MFWTRDQRPATRGVEDVLTRDERGLRAKTPRVVASKSSNKSRVASRWSLVQNRKTQKDGKNEEQTKNCHKRPDCCRRHHAGQCRCSRTTPRLLLLLAMTHSASYSTPSLSADSSIRMVTLSIDIATERLQYAYIIHECTKVLRLDMRL